MTATASQTQVVLRGARTVITVLAPMPPVDGVVADLVQVWILLGGLDILAVPVHDELYPLLVTLHYLLACLADNLVVLRLHHRFDANNAKIRGMNQHEPPMAELLDHAIIAGSPCPSLDLLATMARYRNSSPHL